MSDELAVEVTGETVGEAKWAAVRELERLAPGLDRDAIRFQVVEEGERGILGVGTTPARVVATAPAPPPRPEPSPAAAATDEAGIAAALLERVAAALGLPSTVSLEEDEEHVRATVTGGDTGVLIGRHGQMLDALQTLANATAQHRLGPDRRRIVVDAGGYRARRAATLESLARSTAERVSATGQPAVLEPMGAAERKLVHELLKDDPEVETASEGAEPYRSVVVTRRHAPV